MKLVISVGMLVLAIFLIFIASGLAPDLLIPSPWFWLGEAGLLVFGVILLITWRLDVMYTKSTELEPVILDNEAENTKKASKSEQEKRRKSVPKKKNKNREAIAAKVRKTKAANQEVEEISGEKQDKEPVEETSNEAPKKAEKTKKEKEDDLPVVIKEEKQDTFIPIKPKSKPAKKKDTVKPDTIPFADTVKSELQSDREESATSTTWISDDDKIKLNWKNLATTIDVYREEGIIMFSFSKIRAMFDIENDKKEQKLEKLLKKACYQGLVYLKGNKYVIIQ